MESTTQFHEPSKGRDLSGNRIRREAEQITQSLHEQLGDPGNWPGLKSSKSTIRISKFNLAWRSRLERETGLRSHNETLTYLVENSRRENLILPASLKLIFADDRPNCLSGPSGSGKSLFVKTRLLPALEGPVFLLDAQGEYNGLRKINVGQFFELKWHSGDATAKIRFVPNSNFDVAKGELKTLFNHFLMLQADGFNPATLPSGALSRWCIIVEESHRLARDMSFLSFLAEARKHVRKLIVIASDPALYGSVCRLLKPPPLEELLAGIKR